MTDGPIEITWLSLALSLGVILIGCGVSRHLQLELEVSLLIAALRSIVQLSVLGYILVPIFDLNAFYVVLPYCCFMVFLSAMEAASRQAYQYPGMWAQVFLTIAGAASCVMGYTAVVVLHTSPPWDAHYVIPIFGMLLGNSLTAVSVALSTILEELGEKQARVEFMLSRGAGRWEAVRPAMQRAVRLGTTPLINQMSVAGLVAIPGMMTGQILGGTSPLQAARYQMVVLFLIGGSATLSSYMMLVCVVTTLVDPQLRLRAELLQKKQKFKDSVAMLTALLKRQYSAAKETVDRLRGRAVGGGYVQAEFES